ncbi:hypothetical protein J6590_014482 [Homalodisca vitripennis]|nr:hypothetical protein J6590_014482 [Homalodisca vitripennis]
MNVQRPPHLAGDTTYLTLPIETENDSRRYNNRRLVYDSPVSNEHTLDVDRRYPVRHYVVVHIIRQQTVLHHTTPPPAAIPIKTEVRSKPIPYESITLLHRV